MTCKYCGSTYQGGGIAICDYIGMTDHTRPRVPKRLLVRVSPESSLWAAIDCPVYIAKSKQSRKLAEKMARELKEGRAMRNETFEIWKSIPLDHQVRFLHETMERFQVTMAQIAIDCIGINPTTFSNYKSKFLPNVQLPNITRGKVFTEAEQARWSRYCENARKNNFQKPQEDEFEEDDQEGAQVADTDIEPLV